MQTDLHDKPPVLILEDSRADRARFRLLLPDGDADYAFAWAWKKRGGCSVFNGFEREAFQCTDETLRPALDKEEHQNPGESLRGLLDNCEGVREWLRSFRLLLLDLAWTNHAESVMQEFQQVTARQGSAWARADESTDADLRRLLSSVEGIALLEWLKGRGWLFGESRQLAVWVVSAYVPMTAVGLREFLNVRYGLQGGVHLFHKWMDEGPLISDLRSFLAT